MLGRLAAGRIRKLGAALAAWGAFCGAPTVHAEPFYEALWPEDLTPVQLAQARKAQEAISAGFGMAGLDARVKKLPPPNYIPSTNKEAAAFIHAQARRLGIPTRTILVADSTAFSANKWFSIAWSAAAYDTIVVSDILGASSAAGVAFVLAHEWAHLALKHQSFRFGLSYAYRQRQCPPPVCADSGHPIEVARANMESEDLAQALKEFDWTAEFEADQYADALLTKAGYSGSAEDYIYGGMLPHSPLSEAERKEWSDSHPSIHARIRHLESIRVEGYGEMDTRPGPYPLPPNFKPPL